MAGGITYTPNGVPRQRGYFDPKNLHDTGRAGERNAELGGGGKNTMAGWDYDAGRPRSGAVKQSDGVWTLPGQGGGGGGIPGSAIAAQGLAFAKKAYEQALARVTNQRQGLTRQSGYTFDVDPTTGVMKSMRVDPNSLYGGFQLLNRSQAARSEAARASAIERGLGAGGGLGAQLESEARFMSGQEDANFSSSLIDMLSQLALQQQEAKNAYDMAKWQAELEAARAAEGWGGGGGDWDPGGSPEDVARSVSEGDVPTANQLRGGRYRATPVASPKPPAPKNAYTNKAVQALGQRYKAMARAYGR